MKTIFLFFASLLVNTVVFADDDYSDKAYTGTAFMYWCQYSKIPEGVEDFAKVTDVNDPNPKLTLSPDEWFKSVQFQVKGEELQVIRKTKNGSSTSTSNCGSFKSIQSQSNNSLKQGRPASPAAP